jgi:hypothetical protein
VGGAGQEGLLAEPVGQNVDVGEVAGSCPVEKGEELVPSEFLGRERRAGDAVGDDQGEKARELARSLGAAFVGGAADKPPDPLDAAILFAPVGDLVIPAMAAPASSSRSPRRTSCRSRR